MIHRRLMNRAMKLPPLLLLLLLLHFSPPPPPFSPALRQAQAADVNFISLDCGRSSASGPYDDSVTGLHWDPDETFGLASASLTTTVVPPTSTAFLVSNEQLKSIRYFPASSNHTKYCYTFDDGIALNATYLVRATFWSGTQSSSLPFQPKSLDSVLRFQLLINADIWTNISIAFPQQSLVQEEIFVVAIAPSISVCLSGAGANSADFDTPFISSLEIRKILIDAEEIAPLYLAMRPSATSTRTVSTVFRVDYGSSTGISTRYPEDKYDRIWAAQTSTPRLSTTAAITGRPTSNDPPLPVMQTAYTYDGSYFFLNVSGLRGSQGSGGYAYSLYFAEISSNVTGAGQRVFDYAISTDTSNEAVKSRNNTDLYRDRGSNAVFATYAVTPYVPVRDGGYIIFNFTKNVTSILGPLINAAELYRVSDHDDPAGTDDVDVGAVGAIVKAFPAALASSSGDPCLPYAYDWLLCNSGLRPRIISLSLAHKGLSGQIPPAIANLTLLRSLDLQGNNLSGSIPSFLGNLPMLTTLLLQDNNFSGDIPSSLVDKVKLNALNLSVEGNRFLCSTSINNSANSNTCPSNSSPTDPDKHTNLPLVIGCTIGGVLLIIFLGILFCFLRKCSKRKDANENAIQMTTPIKASQEEDAYFTNQLHVNQIYSFTYKEIEKITNSFAQDHKLGRGGFGDVFYGILSQGVQVAVKVSSNDSKLGAQAFLTEVQLLSRIHHKNLVRLIGFCKEIKLMLVYEYMPNGSLENLLQENRVGKLRFTWSDRLKVALGSAEGLEYLHNGCMPPIIHRDVKSSNILLDKNMEGKISDFGISRTTISSSIGHTATSVMGSRGYLPPDIINNNTINEKVDVYAFGIVLLELVTGHKPIFLDGYAEHYIANWVNSNVVGGVLQSIVDPTIDYSYNVSSMWKVIDLALKCVSPKSNERPQMSEVSLELKNALIMEVEGNDTSELATNFSMNPNNEDLFVR